MRRPPNLRFHPGLTKGEVKNILTKEDLAHYQTQVDNARTKKQEEAKDKVVSFGDKLGTQLTED